MRFSRGLGCAVLVLVSAAAAGEPAAAREALRSAEPVVDEARGDAYAHLMRSVFAARRGEFRAAAAEIRDAIALKPESAALRIQGAELLLWMGRRQDAEQMGREALELDPESPDALRFVADRSADRAMGNRGDEKSRLEAIDLYRRLLRLGHEDDDVLRRLTGLHLQAGDKQGALGSARKLVELRPGDRQATGLLAQLLLEEGRREEALRHVLQYVVRHPDDAGLLRLAEDLTRDLGAWELVEEVFSSHEGFERRPVDAQRLHGDALIQLDRIDAAADAWERALVSDPENRAVRFSLATAYRRLGRLADAAALARGLTEETPGDARSHLVLAETLNVQGDLDGALNAFNTALRILYASGEGDAVAIREAVREQMIELYLFKEQLDPARRMVAELEQPERPSAIALTARIAMAAEDWNSVRQAARRLRALDRSGEADLLEAEVLIRSERWPRAAAKVEEAVAALGPAARVRLSRVFEEMDRPEEGERLLRGWVEQDRENAEASYQLGGYLFELGREEESERAMREAFRLDPSHARALNFLGYSLADRGERLDEALELIRRALELDAWNGAYLDSLGWAYFRLGRYREAREPLEQAAREFPMDPTVLEHLGDLYDRLGERELAVAAWSRALEAEPENEVALRAKIDAGPRSDSTGQAEDDSLEEPDSADRALDDPPPSRMP